MPMPRLPLRLLVLITLSWSVPALAQHPATVFPGTPSQPGMSAPVAFPVAPDPAGLTPGTPATPAGVTGEPSTRIDNREWLLPVAGASASGVDQTLRARLLTMLDNDRRSTHFNRGQPADGGAHLTGETERANLALLRAIVAERGWPTIAMVGGAASQAASAILLYAGDHAWETEMAPELQRLAETGKIFGPDVAEIVDGLLVSSGKPQKFCTQFEIRNGEVVVFPVQNPQRLDEWRARYLLMTTRTWRSILESTYHMTVIGLPDNSPTRQSLPGGPDVD